jgi:copper oxidase (laccase) domain-containing protein
LRAAGVGEENIAVAGICTACHTEEFFSYRKEKVTGRFGTVVGLV